MRTPLNDKIFERSINYMSRDLVNVERDCNKVTGYCKRLGLIEEAFKPNYTKCDSFGLRLADPFCPR